MDPEPINQEALTEELTMNLEKREKNVRDTLKKFMLYFLFHGVFFITLSAQNFYAYDGHTTRFQYAFLILILFYLTFIIEYVMLLRNRREMKRYGWWMRPRIFLKIAEHVLMIVTILLIPFYI